MLQKLRMKFFALAMGLLFLVLVVIVGAVNLFNYRHVLDAADYTLKLLLLHDGDFPERPDEEGRPFDWKMSPERPFETRFFIAKLDTEGEILFVDVEKIAAVTPELALDYVEQAKGSRRSKGFVGEYRYEIRGEETGSTIVFLDCGRQLDAVESFLFISIGVSLFGFLTVSFLLYVLSARVVRPIADSYEKQKQFITNAGHDLKTPITIIDADMDVLEMDYGENEWLKDIRQQTKRLTELIQELILLSRMEEKGVQLQRIEFPISDVVSETAHSFEGMAAAGGKTLTLEVQPMLSGFGDERAIRQLVTILLDNALKYSDEAGKISLSLGKAERSLKLVVSNTCERMETEQIGHLFDRFYRGDASRSSQIEGYGIGLSVAKAITEAHKGTIRAETKDNRSLTITVSLPMK